MIMAVDSVSDAQSIDQICLILFFHDLLFLYVDIIPIHNPNVEIEYYMNLFLDIGKIPLIQLNNYKDGLTIVYFQ